MTMTKQRIRCYKSGLQIRIESKNHKSELQMGSKVGSKARLEIESEVKSKVESVINPPKVKNKNLRVKKSN